MELNKAQLDAHYKALQAAKIAAAPVAPVVYDKKGKTLVEITAHKIEVTKNKLRELEEKLAWLYANPSVPVAAAAASVSN